MAVAIVELDDLKRLLIEAFTQSPENAVQWRLAEARERKRGKALAEITGGLEQLATDLRELFRGLGFGYIVVEGGPGTLRIGDKRFMFNEHGYVGSATATAPHTDASRYQSVG